MANILLFSSLICIQVLVVGGGRKKKRDANKCQTNNPCSCLITDIDKLGRLVILHIA